jgi:type VI protein secretion system component Hcp
MRMRLLSYLNTVVRVLAVAALLTCGAVGTATAGTYLFIEGLAGDSGHPQHVGWIDVTSYSQSVGVKPCLKATFWKNLDRATPGMAAYAMSTQKIPLAIIEVWSGGTPDQLRLRARLEQITVDEVDLLDTYIGVVEQIVLLPRRVTLEHPTQLPSGAPGPTITGTMSS